MRVLLIKGVAAWTAEITQAFLSDCRLPNQRFCRLQIKRKPASKTCLEEVEGVKIIKKTWRHPPRDPQRDRHSSTPARSGKSSSKSSPKFEIRQTIADTDYRTPAHALTISVVAACT